MSSRAWILVIVCSIIGVGIGAFGLKELLDARKRAINRRQAASDAELQRERDDNRQEAAVAFNPPTTPNADDTAEFKKFFDDLGTSLANEDETAAAAAFDIDRFGGELTRLGVMDQFPGGDTPRNRESFVQGMKKGIGKALVQNTIFRWDQTEIRKVRWSADRNEVVVLAVHRMKTDDDIMDKVRWWLIRQPDGRKVYDFEDLSMGLQFSRAIAIIANKEMLREMMADPTRLQSAMAAIREALAAIVQRKDLDEAEEHLKAARGMKLPAPIAAVREMIEGQILLGRGNPEGALRRFSDADRLQPGIPALDSLRAVALHASGRSEEGLVLIRKCLDELGADADALGIEGEILEKLNRFSEATAAYRKGLDEQPGHVECMEGLRRVLAEDEKSELGDRLAKAPEPAKLFDRLTPLARAAEDKAALKALEEGLKKANPNDPRAISARLRRLVTDEHFPEAAAELKTALNRVDSEHRQDLLETYLFAMAQIDRQIEAYAAIPDKHAPVAFRTLADQLDIQVRSVTTDQNTKKIQQLGELTAAHRKRFPNDPWGGFYEASWLQDKKDYEKAEQLFAEAQIAYKKTPIPAGEDKDWDADLFRYRRVECLLALKQGARAYAEVGPVPKTFVQLAQAYERDKDLESLQEMVDVFREKYRGDPLGAFWSPKVLYLKGKYGEAADGFRKFLDDADEMDANRWIATDRCIRGYLRANRLRDARTALLDFETDRVGVALRIAIALADGKTTQAGEQLAELAKKPGGHGFVYYDEDFARLIAKPEFTALRKKYPDPRPAKPAGPAR